MTAVSNFRAAADQVKHGKSRYFDRRYVLGLIAVAELAIADQEAEIFGLRMTLDEAVGRNVQYVLAAHASQCKADLAGEKPGQVIRTTDTRESWVLNDDHEWEREFG